MTGEAWRPVRIQNKSANQLIASVNMCMKTDDSSVPQPRKLSRYLHRQLLSKTQSILHLVPMALLVKRGV